MPHKTFRHLAVCIPACNEAENLKVLLPEIDAAAGQLALAKVSVYVFDDGSEDKTTDTVNSLVLANADLFVVHSRVRVGKSAGLHHCISAALEADADAVVMMDADGQDDPGYIFDLLTTLKSGADVVNGRRTNRAHNGAKRLSSRAFNAAVRAISGENLWDINSGLKGFSRLGAQTLLPYFYGELHRVLLIIALWLGLSVGEVPVTNRPRLHGTTKYGPARGWRGLFDLITIQFLRRYHSRPGHFFSGVGSSLVILGAVFALVGVASAASGGLFGFLFWGGVIMGGFGFMFISFGFLSELMLFLSKNPLTSVTTTTSVSQGQKKR
jgi:glycosyltransferase involved in cell wall biosynthesis